MMALWWTTSAPQEINHVKMEDMRTKFIYAVVLISSLFIVSCNDDDELTPSNLDLDWYTLQDSDDPVDHLRFTLYESYGIPIYYNDTIGMQERGVDNAGETIIYYEVLNPNYSILSSSEYAYYSLSADREAILDGLEFIQSEVLPLLVSKKLYPRSYLLVDTLILNSTSSYAYEANVYRGYMTTCIGWIGDLDGMAASDLVRLGCEIAAEEYATYLMEQTPGLVEEFLNVSRTEILGMNLYSQSLTAYSDIPFVEHLEEYGFLSYDEGQNHNASRVTTINERADVADYVTEVLLGDDEAFERQYAGYSYVLRKYSLMKTIVENINNQLAQ